MRKKMMDKWFTTQDKLCLNSALCLESSVSERIHDLQEKLSQEQNTLNYTSQKILDLLVNSTETFEREGVTFANYRINPDADILCAPSTRAWKPYATQDGQVFGTIHEAIQHVKETNGHRKDHQQDE